MVSLEQNLTVYQGQRAVIEATIYTTDGGATAEVITGVALEATFASPASKVLDDDLTKTIGDGVTITDGANGVCQIVLTATDTSDMDEGDWEWSLWDIDTDSEEPLLIGTITIRETARSRSST